MRDGSEHAHVTHDAQAVARIGTGSLPQHNPGLGGEGGGGEGGRGGWWWTEGEAVRVCR